MLDNETVFKELIIRAQKGDASSYSQLLSDLSLFLKNYLRKRIFEQGDIDEVVQETLMAIHKSLHTYNSEKSFMSWLMAIVEYKFVDYIRALKKRTVHSDLDASNFFVSVQSDSELKIDIDKAMNSLNSREKTILTLLKVQGQSVDEVAKQLNLTESNVKVIAHRAYTNLKVYLGVRS